MAGISKIYILEWYGPFTSVDELRNWEKMYPAERGFGIYFISGKPPCKQIVRNYVGISLNRSGLISKRYSSDSQHQIHELRETLQQAGVKVDAIEVTVASHEFEKNLEQGQSREEQEAERQEEMKEKNRRDLKLSDLENIEDSLDEEEALIARMMKDNGNSLDYTV